MEDVTVVIFYVQQPEWHIFLRINTDFTLIQTKQPPKKLSSYNKNETDPLLTSKKKKKKKIQRIIRDDEIQRKSSSHPDTHSGCSTHSLTFPHSQPHWQITYSFMQTESPSLPHWVAHSVIALRESVSVINSAEQDAACFTSRPVVKAATCTTPISAHSCN